MLNLDFCSGFGRVSAIIIDFLFCLFSLRDEYVFGHRREEESPQSCNNELRVLDNTVAVKIFIVFFYIWPAIQWFHLA